MTPEKRSRNIQFLMSPWGAAMLVVVMTIAVAIEDGLRTPFPWRDWIIGLIFVAAMMACMHGLAWLGQHLIERARR